MSVLKYILILPPMPPLLLPQSHLLLALLLLPLCRGSYTCSASHGIYATGSDYANNLALLLSDMYTATPFTSYHWYFNTYGDGTAGAFGKAYCNVADKTCGDCIFTAVTGVIIWCPGMKVATVVLDVCEISYADCDQCLPGSPSTPPVPPSPPFPALSPPLPLTPPPPSLPDPLLPPSPPQAIPPLPPSPLPPSPPPPPPSTQASIVVKDSMKLYVIPTVATVGSAVILFAAICLFVLARRHGRDGTPPVEVPPSVPKFPPIAPVPEDTVTDKPPNAPIKPSSSGAYNVMENLMNTPRPTSSGFRGSEKNYPNAPIKPKCTSWKEGGGNKQ